MTLLGREELRAALDAETTSRLVVTPILDERQVGPASIDLRLGTEFLFIRRTHSAVVDPSRPLRGEPALDALYERIEIELGQHILLHPGQLLLGATLEYLRFPADLGAYVVGRSSWGRLGLIVATAVMIHPGFTGCLTLELVNEGENPIKLFPGTRIAQLAVHRMAKAVLDPYSDAYDMPIGPEVAKLDRDRLEILQLKALRQDSRETAVNITGDGGSSEPTGF
jgi:dCTP deaminase